MKKIVAMITSIIILLGLILFIVLPKKIFSYNENRYLAKLPEFSFSNLIEGKFTSDISKYISDNFPFREEFLGIKSKTYKYLGVYKQEDVYYGSDNSLFEEYKKPQNSDLIINKINKFHDKISSDVSFMLVPTSGYIYEDNFPKFNNNYDEGKTIDYYKNNIKANFIDVRESLTKEKSDYIYFHSDHHWTSRGAYYAYLNYCKNKNLTCNNYDFMIVSENFYGTLYSKLLDDSVTNDYIERIIYSGNYDVYYEDDDRHDNSLYNYTYLDKKDKYSFFLDNNHSLIVIDNLDKEDESNILVIKDSYANNFIPMLVNNYDKVYVIDPRHYNLSISDYVNENGIDEVLFLYNVLTIDSDLGILSLR